MENTVDKKSLFRAAKKDYMIIFAYLIEKGKTFIYTAEVAVKPEVKLGEYTGLKYTKTEVSCDEEEIEEQIQAEDIDKFIL